MSLKSKPHYTLSAAALADWIDSQPDKWWAVDGDDHLMSVVDFPCPGRFDDFVPKRSDKIAAFVNAASIGKALCESDTWINNATINTRFASLLKDPAGGD